MQRTAMFLNLANDPTIKRISTPWLVLVTAEYLLHERDLHARTVGRFLDCFTKVVDHLLFTFTYSLL